MIKLRRCKLEDVSRITHLQPEGWDNIVKWFRLYCTNRACYPVIAEGGGKIAGVGAAIIGDRTGWLAHIIVDQELRSRGIGFQMTNHLISYLQKKNCTSISLIATKEGEPLYIKSGFSTNEKYLFYDIEKPAVFEHDMRLRPVKKTDYNGVKALDRYVSGEKRDKFIWEFIKETYVLGDNRSINGFYMPDYCEGMIISSNPEAGRELLKLKISSGKKKIVIPASNASASALLDKLGYSFTKTALRMLLGEPLRWRPDLIYSRAGGFYG